MNIAPAQVKERFGRGNESARRESRLAKPWSKAEGGRRCDESSLLSVSASFGDRARLRRTPGEAEVGFGDVQGEMSEGDLL
jgi:hypothetical protein